MQQGNEKQEDVSKVEKKVTDVNEVEVDYEEVSSEEPTRPENSNKGAELVASLEHENSNPFASEIPKPSDSFALVKSTADSLEHMTRIAETMISSQLCPLKKVSDVIVAMVTGNQYGFPFMTSINHIYPITGKPTMSTHLHRALILKHKILFKKVNDYEAVYQFGLLNSSKTGFDFVERPNPQGGASVKAIKDIKVGLLTQMPEGYGIIKEVDRVTRYTFTRYIKVPTGEYEKLTVTSEYKMSDGATAGLLDKENWIKHPARMLDARAFAIGSKEIAADILLGVYTTNELADEYNIRYTIDSNLEENVVITN